MLRSSSMRSNRSQTPSDSDHLPELSDVQCYTCRRRHVKCDRILPHCLKCRKKGIECLGYQKPLRWADGVAVRGKLKGKSQPVLDSNVIEAVQESLQHQTANALQEAARLGLQPSTASCNDVVPDPANVAMLISYYNTTIVPEQVRQRLEMKLPQRPIAALTKEYTQQLPRSVTNCILGISAVHMAVRHPGNREIEKLALETKINVLECHNQLLRFQQNRLDQRPDVVIACGLLIFAMDLLDEGLSRWMIHTLGMMHVMTSLGGIESLTFQYPQLHEPLLYTSTFETMWMIISHVPLTKPKNTSRVALEVLTSSPYAKHKNFNGCPSSLMLAIWDIAACAQKVIGTDRPITYHDMQRRERILVDVISVEPEEIAQAAQEEISHQSILAKELNFEHWHAVASAWKAATTILLLRYLFFGKQELVPASFTPSQPPTPEPTAPFDPFEQNFYVSEGINIEGPIFRSPSASPSPRQYTRPLNSDLWDARYDIHNEAFTTLFSSLAALRPSMQPLILRCVLIPVIILALVSSPNSKERALCKLYIEKAEEHTQHSPQNVNSPNVSIPWDRIDAFSEMITRYGSAGAISIKGGAPEWNWWDMLKQIDLDLWWPITAGQIHLGTRSEFWASEIVASIANERNLHFWSQEPALSSSSTSSA